MTSKQLETAFTNPRSVIGAYVQVHHYALPYVESLCQQLS